MPDLTDSYCERCGARYVFSPKASKGLSLKGARVLARGLKNFVLTDGQSMSDSLTLARNEDDHQDTTRMTEAFYRTFNFCMTCRQYACDRCWNEKVGACLSCSPEPGFQPVAPEDHLIVRTPVARWDTDWSLSPDGPFVEPVARPSPPTHFRESIHLAEPESSAPTAWPVIDLPAEGASVTSGPNAKSGRHAPHKPVDAEAASLWPIADEIAPEMTLTADELELVESSLGQSEALLDLALGRETAPEPQLFDAPTPWAPQRTLAEDVARPAERTSGGATRKVPPAPAWEPEAAVARSAAPVPLSIAPEQPPKAPEADVQPERILSMPQASLPPLGPPAPQPETHERARGVARLLGRHASQTEATVFDQPRPGPTRRDEPTGDAWPRVTNWTSRPVGVHDAWRADDAAAGDIAPELAPPPAQTKPPVQPVSAPESVVAQAPEADTPAPVLLRIEQAEVDARSAAAVRLSAVSAGSAEPVTSTEPQPARDIASIWAAAPETPARPEVDQEAVDARRRKSSEAPGRAQGRRPAPSVLPVPGEPSTPPVAPATPWPPLGASWPAQQAPGAPWPSPETTPGTAAVAAQRAAAPVLDEMWALSAQEVLNRGSVRVCHRCALPVSTQARFCRRCGTQQA